MTLAAAILLSGILPLASLSPGLTFQSASSPPVSISQSSESPEQGTQVPQSDEDSKPPQKPTAPPGAAAKSKSNAAKHARTKKKGPSVNCDSAPKTTSKSTDQTSIPSGSPQASSAATGDATKPCRQSKIVVRQGGISEQSIQLAGGKGGNEASQKRDAANQMLAATEENLRKISERQLNSDEENSASQIRQFVSQSKSAIAAGDLERAQTLAWKAKLLSDDLLNPGQ